VIRLAREATMPRFRHPAIALLVVLALWPTLALGQAAKAGIVTTLKGSATAARAALAQPVNLKFKDDVFLQDRIATAEQSLARLLLGGKAVVTIRERSILTVTEVPDRATLNLESGKIALAVAREKMRPGEVIDIRTPNAVAAVRGTVVIAEARGAGASALSNIAVISDPSGRGVLVTPLNPATGAPIGPPLTVGGLQSYSTATGKVVPIPPGDVGKLTSDLQADPPDTGAANETGIVASQIGTAVALLGSLESLLATPPPPALEPTTPTQSITEVGNATQGGSTLGSTSCTTDPSAPGCATSGGGGSKTLRIPPGSKVSVTGNLFQFDRATSLEDPLLEVTDSVVDVGSSVLSVQAPVMSRTGSPLMKADPTTITAGNDFIRVSSDLSLAGTLFSDQGGTPSTGGRFLAVAGGRLTGTGGSLLRFEDSRVTAGKSIVTSSAVNFPNFSDLSALTLNGAARSPIDNPVSVDGQNVLRLTNNLGQGGSAFLTKPISLRDAGGFLASFSTTFQFQISNPRGIGDQDGQGADGLVFVVQTQANNVGGAGGGIGYAGIRRSLGIEFDTFNNGAIDGNNGNHVGIDLNGDLDSVARANVAQRLNDGSAKFAFVDYNGSTKLLEVRLSDSPLRPNTPLLSLTVDLPSVLGQPDAFVGFTSGTGAGANDHDVRSWQFTNSFDPFALAGAGFIVVSNGGAVSISDPLALLTRTTLTTVGDFLVLDGNGALVTRASGVGPYPLVSQNGGSLTVGTDASAGSIFRLTGTATDPDRERDPVSDSATGLTLGTDQPLQHGGGGPLFETSNGAKVTVANAIKVDTALLAATVPVLNLTGASKFDASRDLVDLVRNAHLTGDTLIRLDGSTLGVNGHVVNVAGGSRLNLTGDLIQLLNGSRLDIKGGVLLNVVDGSVASIAGALVRFGGTEGNVIEVTNSLIPNSFPGGIPVHVADGAIAHISVTGTPLAGLGTLGTITINKKELSDPTLNGSLIAIQGTGGTVKIGK
jgi:hypothetical protein